MIPTWQTMLSTLTPTLAQVGGDAATVITSDELEAWDWLHAAIIFISGMIVAGVVSRLIRKALGGATPVARVNVTRLLGRAVGAVIMVIAFVYALNSIDVRVGPLLGFIGVGGIALAFALQEILRNFISGILIQLRSPFLIGDQVRTNNVEGTVEDVGLRDVTIQTFDGRRVVLPSSAVLQNVIDTDTAFDHRRSEIRIGVAYDTSIDEARRVILEAAKASELVLAEPEPAAYVTELGASAILFSVHVWHTPQRIQEWKVIDDVVERIKVALDRVGMTIPFDQLTLHVAEPVPTSAADHTRSAPPSFANARSQRSTRTSSNA